MDWNLFKNVLKPECHGDVDKMLTSFIDKGVKIRIKAQHETNSDGDYVMNLDIHKILRGDDDDFDQEEDERDYNHLILLEGSEHTKPHKFGLLRAKADSNCLSTGGLFATADNFNKIFDAIPSGYVAVDNPLIKVAIGSCYRGIFVKPEVLA